MPSTITRNFRQYNADQFYEAFGEAAPSYFYVGIGRPKPWSNELSPPTPVDNILETNYNIWRHLLGLKRVQASDVAYCVPRINWVSGVIYSEYDDQNSSLYASQFYVLTTDYNLYKCISNNNGVASTVMPVGTSTSLVTTADGYVWKFMYTLSAPDAMKWLTTSYIPVKTLSADDNSSQWTVQQSAVDGAINKIKILTEGGGYLVNSGTLSAGSTTTVTLPNTASPLAGAYTGSSIFILSGTGVGQLHKIVQYTGSPSYIATVSPAFSIAPSATSTYVISPTVTITGNGTGATAYVNTVTMPSGNVHSIVCVGAGSAYTNTAVTITANTSHGSGATARVVMSPPGGHGSDPVKELGGTNVMMSIKLRGDEGGDITANNDYRMICLFRDPKGSNGSVASAATLSNLTSLNITNLVGTFAADEVITGTVSGAQGTVIDVINTNGTVRVLPYNTKSFVTAEVITGQTSGATALTTLINGSECLPGSGQALFINHRVAIQRSSDQIEDIRHTIAF